MNEVNKFAVYGALAGLVLSDIIPTPGDALYFNYIRELKNDLQSGKITAQQYWTKQALSYYTFNSGWWLLVGIAVISIGETSIDKMKVLLVLVGAGMVGWALLHNIAKDNEELTPTRGTSN